MVAIIKFVGHVFVLLMIHVKVTITQPKTVRKRTKIPAWFEKDLKFSQDLLNKVHPSSSSIT